MPSLQLVLGPDLSVQLLTYDRGDDAGFTREAPGPQPGASAIVQGRVTVDAASTPQRGELAFREMPVSRNDPGLSPVSPVSGTLSWSCG